MPKGKGIYIIAEIGFNHEADMGSALSMIKAAAGAGADAVKFQTFRAGDIALPDSPHYQGIKDMELGLEQHRELSRAAALAGVDFLSTPFSVWAVDLLEEVGVKAYKAASMDLTNRVLLERIARTGKPLLLSTGMAGLSEIAEALDFVKNKGASEVTLLHCISKYPAEAGQLNLEAISLLKETFGVPVGYSDHYPGNKACLAAVMLGATVVETHFTLDRTKEGGDHHHSNDPESLKELVRDIRLFRKMRGRKRFFSNRPDRAEADIFRRGVFAARDIEPGSVLGLQDVLLCRPQSGLTTNDLERILGRKTRKAIAKHQAVSWDDV
ncbi:MAG: N-acetylneuraminate synthase family protein [Thermodesulfobacteriota bacterium]|nr:N-acetylneuraminate synthase family protein [Thermodesulfobacteriota bacterium]